MTDNQWTWIAEGAMAYQVTAEIAEGCLLIQLRSATGATVRHVFPRGGVESVTSLTRPDGLGHQVCVNPTFLVDSVVFEMPSALEALRFHWIIVTKLVELGGGSAN